MTHLLSALLALGLGATFVLAAIPKLVDPRRFVLGVIQYEVLPETASIAVARVIPPLELLVGTALLTGAAPRLAASAAAVLVGAFTGSVALNLLRGRDIDCHCFGRRAERRIGPAVLTQDVALLAAALFLVVTAGPWLGQTAWSPFRLAGLRAMASFAPLAICALLCAAAVGIVRSRRPWWRRPRVVAPSHEGRASVQQMWGKEAE